MNTNVKNAYVQDSCGKNGNVQDDCKKNECGQDGCGKNGNVQDECKRNTYSQDDCGKNGDSQDDYGQGYYENYKSQSGQEYGRGHGWEELFAGNAERIVKEIGPGKTLDIGCAIGFLVEALRDRGVEAYGIDVSGYAISQVREDMKPYCKVQSAVLPIREKYDLITCIEVLEHLDRKEIPAAIQNMCEASDDIIFSSTPFDYDEESHVSVHTPAYWAEQFAYNGFYHDVQYDCSYISVQAMRFRKAGKSKADLIREYETELFQKHQELAAIRQRYKTSKENVQIYKDAYQKHVDMINQELNPKINELNGRLGRAKAELKEAVREEIEGHYRLCLEEELEKRRRLEEAYYKNLDALEEAEHCRMRLDQAAAVIDRLQQEIARRDHAVPRWRRMIGRMKDRQMSKKLLRKDSAYWKPVFDPLYYAEHNQDIYDVYGTDEKELLKHFICYGMQEGRSANEDFDIAAYMMRYPDAAVSWGADKRAAYLHYIADGTAGDGKEGTARKGGPM